MPRIPIVCSACKRPLTGGADTFGPIAQPLCWDHYCEHQDREKGATPAQITWMIFILTMIDVEETFRKKPFWPEEISRAERTSLVERVATFLMKKADGGFAHKWILENRSLPK